MDKFPLYVAAAQVWLAKDRDIRIIMLCHDDWNDNYVWDTNCGNHY